MAESPSSIGSSSGETLPADQFDLITEFPSSTIRSSSPPGAAQDLESEYHPATSDVIIGSSGRGRAPVVPARREDGEGVYQHPKSPLETDAEGASQSSDQQPQDQASPAESSAPAALTPECSSWDSYTNLSIEDLDRAKSLVLDLLGWGVPPEYLVTCGVSSQLLYRVFTDLNLRLPMNLKLPP